MLLKCGTMGVFDTLTSKKLPSTKSISQIFDNTNTLLAAVGQRVKPNQNCHDGMKTYHRLVGSYRRQRAVDVNTDYTLYRCTQSNLSSSI